MNWWKVLIRFHKWMYPEVRQESLGYRIPRSVWEWFVVAIVAIASSCLNLFDVLRGKPIRHSLMRYDHPIEPYDPALDSDDHNLGSRRII